MVFQYLRQRPVVLFQQWQEAEEDAMAFPITSNLVSLPQGVVGGFWKRAF
jgi:hypothetical protein